MSQRFDEEAFRGMLKNTLNQEVPPPAIARCVREQVQKSQQKPAPRYRPALAFALSLLVIVGAAMLVNRMPGILNETKPTTQHPTQVPEPWQSLDWQEGVEALAFVNLAEPTDDDPSYEDALTLAMQAYKDLPDAQKEGILPSNAPESVYVRGQFITFRGDDDETIRAWRFCFGGWEYWAEAQSMNLERSLFDREVQYTSRYRTVLVLSPSGTAIVTGDYILEELLHGMEAIHGPEPFWSYEMRALYYALYLDYPHTEYTPTLPGLLSYTWEDILVRAKQELIQGYGNDMKVDWVALSKMQPSFLYLEDTNPAMSELYGTPYSWQIDFYAEGPSGWVPQYQVSIRDEMTMISRVTGANYETLYQPSPLEEPPSFELYSQMEPEEDFEPLPVSEATVFPFEEYTVQVRNLTVSGGSLYIAWEWALPEGVNDASSRLYALYDQDSVRLQYGDDFGQYGMQMRDGHSVIPFRGTLLFEGAPPTEVRCVPYTMQGNESIWDESHAFTVDLAALALDNEGGTP